MVLTNREIAERFNSMEGADKDKLKVLEGITQIPRKTLRGIIESQNGQAMEVEEDSLTIESAAELVTFEPGTAIYKLVCERLDTLDRIIKSATQEYEELAGYIKNGKS